MPRRLPTKKELHRVDKATSDWKLVDFIDYLIETYEYEDILADIPDQAIIDRASELGFGTPKEVSE
jgi:hypothetical protein